MDTLLCAHDDAVAGRDVRVVPERGGVGGGECSGRLPVYMPGGGGEGVRRQFRPFTL